MLVHGLAMLVCKLAMLEINDGKATRESKTEEGILQETVEFREELVDDIIKILRDEE